MKKKTTKQIKDFKYTIRLETGIDKLESKANTVSEALSMINTAKKYGKNMLYVKNNETGIEKMKILNNVIAQRLFNSKGTMKSIAIKNMSLLFEGI